MTVTGQTQPIIWMLASFTNMKRFNRVDKLQKFSNNESSVMAESSIFFIKKLDTSIVIVRSDSCHCTRTKS